MFLHDSRLILINQWGGTNLKVAIIMPLGEQRGGGEKRLLDLMLEGRNADIKWLLIFQEDGSLVEQIRKLGIDVRVVPSGRMRELHRFLASVLKIASLVRQERADVILSWMWKAHLYGCPAGILAGIPSLWSQLEVPDDYWLKRAVTMLPASGVFINSKSGKAVLEKLCPQRPIRLVYPGVDLHRFNPATLPSPEETRQKLGLPLEVPLIGIIGRLQRWKGIHVLVQAMPKVLKKYPDAHCVVVGGKHKPEPDYGNYLEEQIYTLGLQKQIRLVGLQRNVPEWMQAMDVIVHASNNEPFGIVIVEAMALGKPVVAAANGGPTEIITDGINGLLTPYGNSDALASAILRYLDEPEFAHRVGSAARERSLDFSTQQYAQNFIQAIRELIPKFSG